MSTQDIEKGKNALTAFVGHIIESTHEIVAEWTHNSLENLDTLFLRRAHEQLFQAGSQFWEILQNYSLFSIEELGKILTTYKGDLTPIYRQNQWDNFNAVDAKFYIELSEGRAGECGVRFYNALLECDRRHEHLGGGKGWKLYLALLRDTAMLRVKYDSCFLTFLESKISKSFGVPLESVDEEYTRRMGKEEWLRFLESCPWNDICEVGENMFKYILSDLEDLHSDTQELFIKIDSTNKRFLFRTKAYKLLDPHIDYQKPDEIEDQTAIKVLKIIKGEHSLREVNTAIYAYCSDAIGKLGFCNNQDKCNECEYHGECPQNGFRIGSESSAVNVIYEENIGYIEHDENRENLTKKDFESYTKTFNTNFEGNFIDALNSCLEGNLKHIFLKIATEMDFNSYGLKNVESNKILKHRRWGSWGRCGIECSFMPKKDYHQWFFYGIYFDSNDHKIPFKIDRVPELAFFFDIGYKLIKKSDLEKITANLKNKVNLLEALKRLSQKGFDFERPHRHNAARNCTPGMFSSAPSICNSPLKNSGPL